ncbi:MAG: TolC family protein [Candidatus Omnitrophica bacterium]|nr:TolC family protein [Candidatus Omnitrophota bacterium]
MRNNLRYLLIILVLVLLNVDYVQADSSVGRREKQIERHENELEKSNDEIDGLITENSRLGDYIKVGLSRNPDLKAAFYEWKSSLRKVPQAFSLPDPQLSYADYIESVETRVGPQNQSISVKQKIPLPDKLWIKKNKAFRASEAAYYRFENKRLQLMYEISDAYYEFAYLSKAILVSKENLKLLGNFESVAQAKYSSGIARNQDLLKVQVELGKLENDLYSLEDLKSALVARLNALLNLPKGYSLPWPNELFEYMDMEDGYADMQQLIETMNKNNPQLKAFSEVVKKEKESLKLAKRAYFPDLTIGLTHINTGDALNASMIDSGKDAQMITFSFNVPIWFNRLNAGVDEAKSSLEAAENNLSNFENQLYSKLVFTHYKVRDALRQSRLYEEALIPKAVQTLNSTQSGYEAGNVDFLSLIDAQRMLLDFQLAYYRYHANYHQRLMELKTLLGEVYNSSN